MSSPSSTTRPRVGLDEAGDEVEQRGLAGAVGPDEAERSRLRRARSSTSSTAVMPPKRLRTPAHLEHRSAPRRRSRPRTRDACRRRRRRRRGTPSAGCRAAASSSAVEPGERTSPFSMNTARSATVSATLTDCSTRMIVVPLAWMARTMLEQLLDDDRRQAERQLVDHQQPRPRAGTPGRA